MRTQEEQESLIRRVTGFLSTINFVPANKHPEEMIPWARQAVYMTENRDASPDDCKEQFRVDKEA